MKESKKYSLITGDYYQKLQTYKKGAMAGGLVGGLIAIMFIKQKYLLCIAAGAIAGGYINDKINSGYGKSK